MVYVFGFWAGGRLSVEHVKFGLNSKSRFTDLDHQMQLSSSTSERVPKSPSKRSSPISDDWLLRSRQMLDATLVQMLYPK